MKRLKAFGARRRSFELPSRMTPSRDVPTQDLQVRKLSQVMGINSPPPASSPRLDSHHEPATAPSPSEKNFRLWKAIPIRVKAPSLGSSFSSSDIQSGSSLSSSSPRLSDASSLTRTAYTNMVDQLHVGGRKPPSPSSVVVVAFDVNAREAVVTAVAWALEHVLRGGDVLALLGVMDYVRGPLGYKCQVNDQTWLGANAKHLEKELALRTLTLSATPGLQSRCAQKGVKLVVNVKAASRPEVAIVQDAVTFGAVQLVLDRSLKSHIPRKQKFYLERLTCDVTRMRRSGGVEFLRSNPPTPVPAAAAAFYTATCDDDGEEELFTIDHCVGTAPTHANPNSGNDGDEEEDGYESDDLFSISDVEGALRTSSFAVQQFQLQRGGPPESSAGISSTFTVLDRDPAKARFVPPRSSVESGPRLDRRLLSLQLQLRD